MVRSQATVFLKEECHINFSDHFSKVLDAAANKRPTPELIYLSILAVLGTLAAAVFKTVDNYGKYQASAASGVQPTDESSPSDMNKVISEEESKPDGENKPAEKATSADQKEETK